MLVGIFGEQMEEVSKSGAGFEANVAGGGAVCTFSSCWILEAVVLGFDDFEDFPFLDLDVLDLVFGGSG